MIFFGYGFGTCQLPFFPFFFSFFLFGIRYNIFLSVYLIITTYYFLFFKFSHLKLHDNVFLGCFIFRPYVIKLEQYEVVSKSFCQRLPSFLLLK